MDGKPAAPVTWREALRWAKVRLGQAADRPARAAELLLCAAAEVRREELYARPETVMPPDRWALFRAWVERHRAGEPIQYIVGHETFFGLTFTVNRHVLIPRPETELLVEAVLQEMSMAASARSSARPVRAADIGTGSGVIAITLARLNPGWDVWAVDCSEPALAVARENARRLGVPGIRWLAGDYCSPLVELGVRVDLLVSNPPYVARPEIGRLAPGVRDFEPRLALDGGEDGLDAYRRIVGQLPAVLQPGALVAFEVGKDQAEAVLGLLRGNGFAAVWTKEDLAGIPRFVFARFPDVYEGC